MPRPTRAFEETNQRNPFLRKVEEVVQANLQNEQFSVEALAEQMNMTRSNLHRKLKQTSGQTASQFVREYRLERALELLKKDDRRISEVAYEVGFSSPSYFTSSFTEHYGYPPGEAKFRAKEAEAPPEVPPKGKAGRFKLPPKRLTVVGLVALGILLVILLVDWQSSDPESEGVPAANDQSIAVLPLKNLNVDQEYEYFSEGVVQAINRHLSQIEDLRVVSLTSTDRYRETALSAQEIGKELQVANLLEGSIQRQENTVRIEVRFISASSGQQLWAEKYDREVGDILAIQSEIAQNVAVSLKTTLSSEDKRVLNQATTQSTEAYDLYLKGKFELRTYTPQGTYLSIDYFERAIALDPDYAPAYAGLATAHIYRATIIVAELSSAEAMSLAKPLLEKALALDPELPEANTGWAYYLLQAERDFEGADRAFKKAIATNNQDALATYSDFLNYIRKHEEALVMAKRLEKVDPYHPNIQMVISLYFAGKYQEAETFAQSRLKILNSSYLLGAYGFLLLNTNQYLRAIEIFHRALSGDANRLPRILAWLGAAYAHHGNREKAEELIQELKIKIAKEEKGSPAFFIAVIYSALGDKASALEWLYQAYERHEQNMLWLISEPQFYNLHDEPEFQQLVEAVGFPPYSAL